jgi:predicted nucleic acid-binding protein
VAGRPAVYADATALIGLSRIGRLDLLAVFPDSVLVTTHVWQEVARVTAKPGTRSLLQARDAGLLTVVYEGDADAYPQLDAGEATVLAAAAAAGAGARLNERRARAPFGSDPYLRSRIPEVMGVIGLVLLARSHGHVPLVRPLLDDLIREEFRIGPSLYEEVLRRAGEL